jgi:isopentenyldiphosphate isomerase
MGKDEAVDLVDEHDRKMGSATLDRCLREGLRHRAVAVLVVRSDGRVLIQVRSKNDHWQPGRWTLSCTGHVGAGESYGHAAKRELEEELGLTARVSYLGKLFLPKVRCRGSVESEVVSLFTASTDAAPKIDPVELDGVRELDPSDLEGLMGGRRLTPDAKLMLREYWRLIPGRPSYQQSHRGRRRPARVTR